LSAEAARIIKKISGKKTSSGLDIMLGTVKTASPLTVKFDDVSFDISAGLLVNPDINLREGLKAGDRVAGIPVGGTQYLILCKAVAA